MDHFTYREGSLFAEDVPMSEIAAHVGTPTYVYSAATLRLHYRRLVEAFAPIDPLICFSIKSNSNLGVLRLLAQMGSGMDVVSGGELHRARLAGVPASRIVYAGVGKTDEEIEEALGGGRSHEEQSGGAGAGSGGAPIFAFNIESEQEFQNIAAIAAAMKVSSRAALRINPDVDPHTHKHTTTGTKETKFGVDLARAREFFRHYAGHPYLKLTGLHLHLGSPIYTTEPYAEALRRTLGLIDQLKTDGQVVDTLDLGGGFGADYRTGQTLTADDYAKAIVPMLIDRVRRGEGERAGKSALRVVLEPGRFIAANAGVLLTRVQYVKVTGTKKFVICDAGMHTLIRPALYEAFHFVWPASCAPQHVPPGGARGETIGVPGLEECDVVGPICETADYLALGRKLPPVARGDLMGVFTAGAYGMTMASRYNSHALPAEVLVDGARAWVVRRREGYEDLVAHERTAHEVEISG